MPQEKVKYANSKPPAIKPDEIVKCNQNPEIPKLYINGFSMAFTNSDILILWKLTNEPKFLLNMSLTTAKTLVQILNEMILNLETNAERDIMTIPIMDMALAKMRGEQK